jgi:hypothetical protein
MLDMLRGTPLWVYAVFFCSDLLWCYSLFQKLPVKKVSSNNAHSIRSFFFGFYSILSRCSCSAVSLRVGLVWRIVSGFTILFV